MASNSNNTFGFELLYKVSENQISKKEDVIILLAHWFFIKNGFRCIGFGDSKTLDQSDQGSELLPEEWSKHSNYALRYVKEGKLYILLGTKSDEDLLLNLMRIEDHKVSNVQFPIGTTVNNLHGTLESLLPNYQAILDTLRKDLVEPVYTTPARETSTQTTEVRGHSEREIPGHPIDYDDPLRVGPPRHPGSSTQPWIPYADPSRVGRSDLDPFSEGGGMIFDPFAPRRPFANPLAPGGPGGLGVPGRLPPGAVPPGARFDPFGPPDVNRPRPPPGPPDSDHFPPPGYDDMFM
ncbi:proteasome inhibitor PI31 subunit [Cephus cinctus]|uniref:Proteasome inhibitor PI31 subunit n=1 Tax=Cephus cinctus TaxID=211228 RepID=A0AAJ7FNT7_CEPCN|nr:proteasome inhibitor PI31 subunit [Cephus cinctus]